MKIQVKVVHPVPSGSQAPLDHWRIKWNGPGTLGAYTPSPDQQMAETVVDTGQLSGVDGDHYTVAVEWFDTFGQKSILVLPTVTLHVDANLPAAPSAGSASQVVVLP
jgi:hypothetical protein